MARKRKQQPNSKGKFESVLQKRRVGISPLRKKEKEGARKWARGTRVKAI